MKTVVLGGSGFIGRELLRALSRDPSIELSWIARRDISIPTLPAPEIVEDLQYVDECRLAKADVIIDLVSSGRGRFASTRNISRRIYGHCRLIDGLMNIGSKIHYIHVSSGGAVYGDIHSGPLHEELSIRPNTEYGLEKAIIEMHLHTAMRVGLRVSLLRVGNAYGVGQSAAIGFGVVPTLVNALSRKSPFQIFGSGNARRDYIEVRDIVTAIQAAMRHDGVGVVNIGTNIGTSTNDLVALIEDLSGTPLHVAQVDSSSIEPPDSILDCSRASRIMDWVPKVDLRSGLANILAEAGLLHADHAGVVGTADQLRKRRERTAAAARQSG